MDKKILFAVGLLLGSLGSIVQAAPVDLDGMTTYADNAILNAAEHGEKHITLVFGHAPVENVEALAQSLRERGYRIDEESELLNPLIIKVQHLMVLPLVKNNEEAIQ